MPWKEVTVVNERVEFVSRLKAGERMSDLCREFGISRKTGYKFEQRYEEHGPKGLYDFSRRPRRLARQISRVFRSPIAKTGSGTFLEGREQKPLNRESSLTPSPDAFQPTQLFAIQR